MQRFLLTTTAAALLATNAFAAFDMKPLSGTLAEAPAGTYELEKNHASITFKVMHMGLASYTMRFDKFDATIDLDPKTPEKSTLKVTIDPKSLDSNNPALTEHATGADFLDVAKYPTITFASTKIEKTGDNTGKVYGNLTLHGVTKPVVLDAKFNAGGPHPMMKSHALGFSSSTAFKRSDFGIAGFIPVVGDDINVVIETEFLKSGGEGLAEPVKPEKK